MSTVYYNAQVKNKETNPFYVIVDQEQHLRRLAELSKALANANEQLLHWVDTDPTFADQLLVRPASNMYGKADEGTNKGQYNSPLACLAGAVNKMSSMKLGQLPQPNHSDLSKVQITNLKKVLTLLNNKDSKMFPKLEWQPTVDNNDGLGSFAKKVAGKIKKDKPVAYIMANQLFDFGN